MVTIEQIASAQQSAMSTGPFGSSIGSKHFTDFGVPVIRGSNLSSSTSVRLSDDGLVFVSREKAKEFQRSIVRKDDLVFTCWGTINQVGFIDGRSKFDEYIVSNKQMKLTLDKSKAYPLYIYYVFSGPEKQREILDNGIGSSVPGFNLGQLKKHEILLPPLSEQKRIAEFLANLDDRITLLRETNATLEAMAQALFKSWFVDFDPVHAKQQGRTPEGMDAATAALFPDSFEESELGMVPKGWRLLPLSDAYEINPFRKLSKGQSATYLDMANVPVRGYSTGDLIQRNFSSGTKFKNHDTLLARITPCLENGKTAYVDFLSEGAVAWGSTEFIVLRPKPPLHGFHAYLLCRSTSFRKHAIQSMSGTSGRQRVQNDMLGLYLVAVPSDEIAAKFSEISEVIQASSSANEARAKNLGNLRDTLLPRLISGQLRLPEAEALAEQAMASQKEELPVRTQGGYQA